MPRFCQKTAGFKDCCSVCGAAGHKKTTCQRGANEISKGMRNRKAGTKQVTVHKTNLHHPMTRASTHTHINTHTHTVQRSQSELLEATGRGHALEGPGLVIEGSARTARKQSARHLGRKQAPGEGRRSSKQEGTFAAHGQHGQRGPQDCY